MHILIVDDSAEFRSLVRRVLNTGGFSEVSEASSAEETNNLLGLNGSGPRLRRPVDLLIMDIRLPGIDGIAACRRIKSGARLRDVPVVMLTGSNEIELLEQAFEAGANDYLVKPFRPIELLARLKSWEKSKDEMEQRKARELELLEATKNLERALKELSRLSRRDALTGISNRRDFDEVLQREWNRAGRNQSCLSLALVDIDHFKAFNDTYGHQAGDSCLKAVGGILLATARRTLDLCARYGGEEFAVILTDTDHDHALELMQLLRQGIEGLRFDGPAEHSNLHVTASIGLATKVPAPGEPPEQLIEEADKALYHSKANGRNCVTHAREILLSQRRSLPVSVSTTSRTLGKSQLLTCGLAADLVGAPRPMVASFDGDVASAVRRIHREL